MIQVELLPDDSLFIDGMTLSDAEKLLHVYQGDLEITLEHNGKCKVSDPTNIMSSPESLLLEIGEILEVPVKDVSLKVVKELN